MEEKGVPSIRSRKAILVGLLALALGMFTASTTGYAVTDYDGDGYTTDDCAPLDPAVHPGAVDRPDLSFEDTNCDGVDGDIAKAVWVAKSGDDGATGTR